MPTFGDTVAARAWPLLKAAQGLQSIVLTTRTAPTLDLTTGAIGATSTTATYDALVLRFMRWEVDGVRVSTTDRRVLLRQADRPTAPSLHSAVTIAGASWEVIGVEARSNEGLWQLQVRQLGVV
jgi:hypothetical protein